MRKFTKALALLLLVTLVFLSACQGAENPPSTAPSSDAATADGAATQDDSGELEEVELICYMAGMFPMPDQDMVFEEFNKMLKEKINATVDFRVFDWGTYADKMQTIISAGDEYDLCFTSNWSNDFVQNVAKGAFMPLDDLLTEYAPQLYASMPEGVWDGVRIDGQIYGVINQQVYATSPAVHVSQKALTESGYDESQYVIGDLLSLEPMIEYISTNYEDSFFQLNEWLLLATVCAGLEPLGGAIPAMLDVEDGKTIVNPFKTEGFIKGKTDLQYFNSKGYLRSEIRANYSDDFEVPAAEMGFNEELVYGIYGTYMPGYDAIMSQKYTPEDYGWQHGWPSIEPYVSANNIQATLMGINANSKNPERAMMLLELMNLPAQEGESYNELFNTFHFGLEGVHWEYTEDGRRHWITTEKYMPGVDWGFGCQFVAVPQDTMDVDVYVQQAEYNANAKLSPAFGFSFNPEPVKSEVANCSNIIAEYQRRLVLGTITDAEYDELVNKMDQAGADTIIAEMQAQLDAFFAA